MDARRLLREARESAGGEAYAAVAKDTGFRLGMGARTDPEDGAAVFIEIVLDPFPDRPRVHANRLAAQGQLIAQLEARGYAVCCDDDSTVTCERTVMPDDAEGEIRAVLSLTKSRANRPGSRARRSRRA